MFVLISRVVPLATAAAALRRRAVVRPLRRHDDACRQPDACFASRLRHISPVLAPAACECPRSPARRHLVWCRCRPPVSRRFARPSCRSAVLFPERSARLRARGYFVRMVEWLHLLRNRRLTHRRTALKGAALLPRNVLQRAREGPRGGDPRKRCSGGVAGRRHEAQASAAGQQERRPRRPLNRRRPEGLRASGRRPAAGLRACLAATVTAALP